MPIPTYLIRGTFKLSLKIYLHPIPSSIYTTLSFYDARELADDTNITVESKDIIWNYNDSYKPAIWLQILFRLIQIYVIFLQ